MSYGPKTVSQRTAHSRSITALALILIWLLLNESICMYISCYTFHRSLLLHFRASHYTSVLPVKLLTLPCLHSPLHFRPCSCYILFIVPFSLHFLLCPHHYTFNSASMPTVILRHSHPYQPPPLLDLQLCLPLVCYNSGLPVATRPASSHTAHQWKMQPTRHCSPLLMMPPDINDAN